MGGGERRAACELTGQIRPELYSGHCGSARFHEHLPSDRVGKSGRALQADDAAKQRERDGDGAERPGGVPSIFPARGPTASDRIKATATEDIA